MQNNKQSLANQMQKQTQLFQRDQQEKNERSNKEEVMNTYIGKKKHPKETSKETSKTVFNFIPLPFDTDDGQRSVRLISDGFSIIYDTDIPYDKGTGTQKKFFNIASIKEFKAYESAFGTKVLSPDDEALVKQVQQKLWQIKKYFPYFDNAINLNKENLSADFLDAHGGKLRINYFPYYMLIPTIELSEEIYSATQGDNTSKIKRYSLFHFNKSYLIEDWNKWMNIWQTKPEALAIDENEKKTPDYVSLFEKTFGGPDKAGNITRYLSMTISDDAPNTAKQEDKKDATVTNPANNPNRLTKLIVKKYIPELFASEEEGPLSITPELLSQVKNLYDLPNFFRVATFERDNYTNLLMCLNTAEDWLREEGINFGQQTPKSAPKQPIAEDDVPF